MRNSDAQRYARWSAALAGVIALVVTGVYLHNVWLARQAEKKAPPAVPTTIEQRSNEFSFSKVEGQRTIYTVKASRATQFKEGSRNLLEDVEISVYGKQGERNDKLRTNACDFISNTGKVSCAGEVLMNLEAAGTPHASANAIQVVTTGVTFDRDSGQTQTDKPVMFHWPAGEGRALGVRYDSNTGTLHLEHNVELNLLALASPTPKSGNKLKDTSAGQLLHLTGNSLAFQREARTVQIEGNVHAQQTTHELSAQGLLVELDGDFRGQRIIATGHPQLDDLDSNGPISLSADQISSELRPDGSVASILATGSVRGTRSASAGRDEIEAGRLQIDLATRQNTLRLLTASDGVTLNSTATAANGGTRRMKTEALEVRFRTSSNPGQTLVENVRTLAPAQIEWRNVAAVNGKPTSQTTRMIGKQMTLSFDARNQIQQLVGAGGVEVGRKLGDATEQTTASRELTAKFSDAGEWSTIDQSGDVHFQDGERSGQGDRAHADRIANDLTLVGSVVFADSTTRTTAQTATFTQGTPAHGSNTVRADGHVVTTELRGDSASISNFAQEPSHVSAEHLVADTTRGHAVYTGGGRLWQGQSVIEADTIELDSASHTIVGTGHMRGVFPQAAWNPKPSQASLAPAKETSNRSLNGNEPADIQLGHVRGQSLTYWEQESRARIEQDARVDAQHGSIQADQIDLFFSDGGAANATKQLSRSVATGNVIVHQEDRRGTSNRAEYTASEGKFVLSEGKPTLYSSTGDTTTGRQLTFYFADDRIVVDSAEGSKTVTLHRVEK